MLKAVLFVMYILADQGDVIQYQVVDVHPNFSAEDCMETALFLNKNTTHDVGNRVYFCVPQEEVIE